MTGCGLIPDSDLVRYLDGTHRTPDRIEEHLRACPGCLEETLDLNRLEARSETYQGGRVRKPGLVSVIREHGNRLAGLLAQSGVPSALCGVATRGPGDRSDDRGVEFVLHEPDVTVQVWSDAGGQFRVRLFGPVLAGKTVQLHRAGEKLPVLSLAVSGTGDVNLKGLDAGEYDAIFAPDRVRISLQDAGADAVKRAES